MWLPGNGPYTSRHWTVYATTLAVQACVFSEPYIHIATYSSDMLTVELYV